jgi:hypothetical protein
MAPRAHIIEIVKMKNADSGSMEIKKEPKGTCQAKRIEDSFPVSKTTTAAAMAGTAPATPVTTPAREAYLPVEPINKAHTALPKRSTASDIRIKAMIMTVSFH